MSFEDFEVVFWVWFVGLGVDVWVFSFCGLKGGGVVVFYFVERWFEVVGVVYVEVGEIWVGFVVGFDVFWVLGVVFYVWLFCVFLIGYFEGERSECRDGVRDFV